MSNRIDKKTSGIKNYSSIGASTETKAETAERVISALNTPSKKEVFFRCIECIQTNSKKFHGDFTNSDVKNNKETLKKIIMQLGINEDDFDTIFEYSRYHTFDMFFPKQMAKLLSKLGYSKANFSHNLSMTFHASKEEMTLSFENLDLTEIEFTNLNFKQEETGLLKVNFKGAKLYKVNFTGTNLTRVDFSGSILEEVSFENAELHKANFERCRLINITIQSFNCVEAIFRHCELIKVTFVGDFFYGVKFTKSDLRGVIFERINKSRLLYMRDVDFVHTNLSQVNLQFCNLEKVNFSNANLENVDLSHSKIFATNLSKAKVKNLKCESIEIHKTSLSDININELKSFSLDISSVMPSSSDPKNIQISEQHADSFFNHLANGSSLLTMLNSLDDSYSEFKLKCFEQIIVQINNLDSEVKRKILLIYIENFEDVLMKNPIYIKSDIILKFIEEEILPYSIEYANKNKFEFTETEFELYYKVIENKKDDKDFYQNSKGFICQYIYSLKKKCKSELLKWKAIEIEPTYLKFTIPESAQNHAYKILDDLGEYEDGEEKTLKDYMLVSSDDNKRIALIPYNYYEKFLLKMNDEAHSSINWSHFFYFTSEGKLDKYKNSTGVLNLKEIFNHIPLFKSTYNFEINQLKTQNFFKSLKLDSNLELFLTALTESSLSEKKFMEESEQTKLSNCLKGFIQSDKTHDINSLGKYSSELKLTEKFKNEILDIYDLASASDEEKAILFASMASLFVKLSSSYFFGDEINSPLPLRNLALAFLNASVEYKSDLFTSSEINDWKDRLSGLNGAFTCTAILFNMMENNLKNHPLFGIIIPPPWK